MLQAKSFRENQNTHFVFSYFFFRNTCRLWENVEKYFRAGHATDDNMAHSIASWMRKAINTHTACVILVAFLQWQWLNKRARMLRYKYIVCLVCFLFCST